MPRGLYGDWCDMALGDGAMGDGWAGYASGGKFARFSPGIPAS
jgi:hypothetical protein